MRSDAHRIWLAIAGVALLLLLVQVMQPRSWPTLEQLRAAEEMGRMPAQIMYAHEKLCRVDHADMYGEVHGVFRSTDGTCEWAGQYVTPDPPGAAR